MVMYKGYEINKMSNQEFIITAKCTCKYYTEPYDGELVYCTHKDNQNSNKGNCTQKDCPIIKHIKKLFKAHNILQKGDEIIKINMNKKYTYKNGEPARILCVDGYLQPYSVVSMDKNGGIHSHDLNGMSATGQDDFYLIEIWEPKKGDWCLFTSSLGLYALRKFDCIVDELYVDSHGTSWPRCYKFDGTLPNDIRNENE